ncbi:MAG: hypothetical protein DRO46_03920, partial [Candidatus Hecatellales archaeon]
MKVPREVYEPSDDSFLLAESLKVRKGERVLDLGCGSGFLGLLAAARGSSVVAVDINPEAIRATRENAEANGLASRVEARQGDLFSPLRK